VTVTVTAIVIVNGIVKVIVIGIEIVVFITALSYFSPFIIFLLSLPSLPPLSSFKC
jgi:hypothetical protein